MKITLPHFGFALAACMAATLSVGCTSIAERATTAGETVFVIVRHAEKGVDDAKDPSLSKTGHARAQQLATLLSRQQVSAVYASRYRRTQQTAAPTATANRLAVRTYDAALPAADFAAELLASRTAGTTLVVGHSNTVSAISEALCTCPVAPLREDEYDRIITIRISTNGQAILEDARD